MTPIGVGWGLVEAWRFHWWLAVLMGALRQRHQPVHVDDGEAHSRRARTRRDQRTADLRRRGAQQGSDPHGARVRAARDQAACSKSPRAPASTCASSRPRCPAFAGSPPSPTKPRAKPLSTRIREAGLENVAQPIALDVRRAALARARTLRRGAVHQHDPHLAVARHARAVPRRRAAAATRRAS